MYIAALKEASRSEAAETNKRVVVVDDVLRASFLGFCDDGRLELFSLVVDVKRRKKAAAAADEDGLD